VRKRILIVDDSDVMRLILKNTLERNRDWIVDADAKNGREAIAKAKEIRPDLAVLDFSMPAMDGLELAAELKRIDPKMFVVILTALKDKSLDEKAYKAGVTWVLSKAEGLGKVVDFARILLRSDPPSILSQHSHQRDSRQFELRPIANSF
jgi:DNA-binding NarL/FixJ family response regulator